MKNFKKSISFVWRITCFIFNLGAILPASYFQISHLLWKEEKYDAAKAILCLSCVCVILVCPFIPSSWTPFACLAGFAFIGTALYYSTKHDRKN